jgi:4-hydroxythreonine-4-phosphate dehydrogenase
MNYNALPLFISFEGIEGSGKSTQAKILYDSLKEKEYPVILTREPGGTVIGNNIREILIDKKNNQINPLTELMLNFASRIEHLQQVILPALKNKQIDGLVTAPIHKKNIQSPNFNFSGHTPYLQAAFGNTENLMLLVADNLRMALVTEHVTIQEVGQHITKDKIKQKLSILNSSLKKDFGIDAPRIAVLALNPHAGDEGLIGKEEIEIIKPAIKESKQQMLVYGPYSADAFFARGAHEKFDGVLAMYHDQGLIPFKSLAFGEGVNFTAGLPIVRTSPDHGTAFDIAGKAKADAGSFTASIFECARIIHARQGYTNMRLNPLKKISARMFAGAVDERLDDN